MSRRTNRIWFAAGAAIAVGGVVLGGALRNKYERDRRGSADGHYYASQASSAISTDRQFGNLTAGEYFEHVHQLLVEQFVNPVGDERKLGDGAVQFMLQELRDPGARFYTEQAWSQYIEQFEGNVTGVGADLAVMWKGTTADYELPLTVVSVLDGGSAQQAGIQPADVIDSVEGQWVGSRSLIRDLQALTAKRDTGKLTQDQFQIEFDALRQKSLSAISINDALQKLSEFTGDLKIRILRNGEPVDVLMKPRNARFEPVEYKDGVLRIRSFAPGIAEKITSYDLSTELVVDLTNNPGGAFDVMEACLTRFIPAGPYAKSKRRPDAEFESLNLNSGTVAKRSIRVIVNRGTAREAELFAIALRDRAGARVEGGAMAGLGQRLDRHVLGSGAGYTIPSARFFDLAGGSLYVDKFDDGKPALAAERKEQQK